MPPGREGSAWEAAVTLLKGMQGPAFSRPFCWALAREFRKGSFKVDIERAPLNGIETGLSGLLLVLWLTSEIRHRTSRYQAANGIETGLAGLLLVLWLTSENQASNEPISSCSRDGQ